MYSTEKRYDTIPVCWKKNPLNPLGFPTSIPPIHWYVTFVAAKSVHYVHVCICIYRFLVYAVIVSGYYSFKFYFQSLICIIRGHIHHAPYNLLNIYILLSIHKKKQSSQKELVTLAMFIVLVQTVCCRLFRNIYPTWGDLHGVLDTKRSYWYPVTSLYHC